MLLADTLPRAVVESQHTEPDEVTDEKIIYTLEATDALDEDMLKHLNEAIQKDDITTATRFTGKVGHNREISSTQDCISTGQSETQQQNKTEFCLQETESSFPKQGEQSCYRSLNGAHRGMQRTKAHARNHLYWPGMTRDIEQMVEMCTTCQQYQPKNQKEPPLSHDIPEFPWLKVAVDIFKIRG